MSKSLKILKDVYSPFAAIIAYRTEEASRNFYLERRSIKNGRMGVGKPLTEKAFAQMLQNVHTGNAQLDNSMHGVIPPNVLFCDCSLTKEKLVWFHGPEERYLFFKDDLDIPNGKMKVPGLVYVATKEKFAMYAFKGRKPTNKLYRAPFMNVSESYVCLGNSKVKKPNNRTFVNVMAYWEKMFWLSEFSHILGGNPVKGNLAVLTKRLMDTGNDFPTDELEPVQQTLKGLLK